MHYRGHAFSSQLVAQVCNALLLLLAMQVRQVFTAWLRQYVARLRQESWQAPGAAERRTKLMQSCNPRYARLASGCSQCSEAEYQLLHEAHGGVP